MQATSESEPEVATQRLASNGAIESPAPRTQTPAAPAAMAAPAASSPDLSWPTAASVLASAALAACGGGGGAGDEAAPAAGVTSKASGAAVLQAPEAFTDTDTQISRFLSQAAFGATSAADIQAVRNAGGYTGWIDVQVAIAGANPPGHVAWMDSLGYRTPLTAGRPETAPGYAEYPGFPHTLWRALVTDPCVLRQRMALALSEILVVTREGIMPMRWRGYALAYYQELLENGAFGNYFDLLKQVALAPAMGTFLSHRMNRMQTANSFPDENFAREIMQLFSLGLFQVDATGKFTTTPTYEQRDVTELARVFTGLIFDESGNTSGYPSLAGVLRPMVATTVANWHDPGTKKLFTRPGSTAPWDNLVIAGGTPQSEISAFIDNLRIQPSVAPFICRQLIQRFVTANPSLGYVKRVAQAFSPAGAPLAQRGNLGAALKALLTDAEARLAPDTAVPVPNEPPRDVPNWGKLREPIVRLVQWARSCGYPTDAAVQWDWGDTGNAVTRLGQSPLNAPSVFNFFRPGFVPPGTGMALANPPATSPEFQITNESSVAGWINLMQQLVQTGFSSNGPHTPSYAGLQPADSSAASVATLVDTLNLRLAGGSLGTETLALMKTALFSQGFGTDTLRMTWVAVLMVLSAPEYLVLK